MNDKQQLLYDLYRTSPPRRFSGSLATAYHRGLTLRIAAPYPRTSLAHAAWMAGRDRRKETEK
jgi:hypothetical protein